MLHSILLPSQAPENIFVSQNVDGLGGLGHPGFLVPLGQATQQDTPINRDRPASTCGSKAQRHRGEFCLFLYGKTGDGATTLEGYRSKLLNYKDIVNMKPIRRL